MPLPSFFVSLFEAPMPCIPDLSLAWNFLSGLWMTLHFLSSCLCSPVAGITVLDTKLSQDSMKTK